MRIACIGGGPGGLFLALLLRRMGHHTVDVFDRTHEDATYGFGVVLSRLSVARLRSVAKDVMDDILRRGVRWQSVEARFRGAVARSSGHDFGAVERRAMLRVLKSHAVVAGARVLQPCRVDSTQLLNDYDIVVAADGAGSGTRTQLADSFRPTVTHGTSQYVWFGANRPFSCMTFLLADGGHGLLGAHVYPYSATQSTFLVEAPERVWRSAGIAADDAGAAGRTDEGLLRYCQDVFARDLDGAALIGNGSRLLDFAGIRNERWSAGRVVMLGDAAHTAHFSVGSGTSMAMEDAAELASSLSRIENVEAALGAYEAARRPVVSDIQLAAWASRQFWEQLNNEAHRDIGAILLRLLTRTGQTDLDLLRRIDPGLSSRDPCLSSASQSAEPGCAVPLSECAQLSPEMPFAVLVHPHEVDLIGIQQGPPQGRGWTEVALVVDCDTDDARAVSEAAAQLTKLRAFVRGVAVGIFHLVRGGELPQVAAGRVHAFAAALCSLVPMDFISIGCMDHKVASRTMQMSLCEFVRTHLGLTSIYACLPVHAGYARTHVEAARADRIWLLRSPP